MSASFLGFTAFPVLAALLMSFTGKFRKYLVLLSSILIAVSGISFVMADQAAVAADGSLLMGLFAVEVLIVGYLLFWGLKLKNPWILLFNLIQLGLLAYNEFGLHSEASGSLVTVDFLTRVLVLLITVIGPLICIFAIPYMEKYEEEKNLEKSKQGRFFFLLFLFLGGMGLLVTADHFSLLSLGWEITTLCSFLLIGHNRDEESMTNATRALVINSLGGICLTTGALIIKFYYDISSLSELLSQSYVDVMFYLALALMITAGLTKAAQMPFQSWLLGAMVAPTPVSALLHSSTMVKAGVYLVLRLSPAFQDTALSSMVALIGGFTFLVTSALAVSQYNGKRILAYSTISNLGLIVMCAGLNTPLAMGAAIFLIIFHAVSKALLFLCVGTIELKTGSKDIETMHGLVEKLPFISFAALVGMITMFLPPFGMVAGKWAAMEAVADLPVIIPLIALGSAFTVVFWLKWAGSLMTTTKPVMTIRWEKYSPLASIPLLLLVGGAVILSLFADRLFELAVGVEGYALIQPYYTIPVFFALVVAIVAGMAMAKKASTKAKFTTPYMCGETTVMPVSGELAFKSAMDKEVPYQTSHYYLKEWFAENKLTATANLVAILLIAVMIGVVVK